MNTNTTRLARMALTLALLLGVAGCTPTSTRDGAEPTASGQAAELTEDQRQDYLAALESAAQGDYPTAVEQLQRLSREQPDHPGIWLNLAAIYYESDQVEQAKSALQQGDKLDPDNALIQNLRGALALNAGEIEQAEQYYRSALEKNQELAEAHYNLALLHDTYYQDLATAIEHYRAYLELIPEEDETTRQWVQQLQRSLNNQ